MAGLLTLAACEGPSAHDAWPYVQPRSDADVWDYSRGSLRFRIRRVEYAEPIEIPHTARTTTTTVEVFAEAPDERALPHVGFAIGSRVLSPAPWGFGSRVVEYAPERLREGAKIQYGFTTGVDTPTAHELSTATDFEFHAAGLLRYRFD